METGKDKDPNFVTALGRGLDILRCFVPGRAELGTTEIARLTGLPQSTVWRLCYTLGQYGCLLPGSNPDRLRIGPGVLLLGHAAITHTGIAETALPRMREIAEVFDASVSLAERNADRMVIVQRAEAHNIVKVDLHVGSTLPIEVSSLGLSILAALPVDERRDLMKELRRTPRIDAAKFEKDVGQAVADYGKLGFIFNLELSHRDINAIGVPVLAADGRPVMALTCGGARSRLTREILAKKVAPELKGLAQMLGPLAIARPAGAAVKASRRKGA